MNTGGYVHPITERSVVTSGGVTRHEGGGGMTMREHYAGLAMQALILSEAPKVGLDPHYIAPRAVDFADALLEVLGTSEKARIAS